MAKRRNHQLLHRRILRSGRTGFVCVDAPHGYLFLVQAMSSGQNSFLNSGGILNSTLRRAARSLADLFFAISLSLRMAITNNHRSRANSSALTLSPYLPPRPPLPIPPRSFDHGTPL